MTEKRARRTFSEEQKKQLVELFNHGKPRSEIIREYDLTGSAFDRWVKRINATGSDLPPFYGPGAMLVNSEF